MATFLPSGRQTAGLPAKLTLHLDCRYHISCSIKERRQHELEMTMSFRPVQSRKLYLAVVDQVLDAVRAGGLRPGDQLPPELQFTRQLHVSRGAVREALTALEVMGITESRVGVGSFIRANPQVQSVALVFQASGNPLDILEVRKVVEPLAAGRAASERVDDDVARLHQELEAMEKEDSPDSYFQHDLEFHLAISRATRNPLLMSVMNNIVEAMRAGYWKTVKGLTYRVPGHLKAYREQHRRIADAIADGQPQVSEDVMREHLAAIERDILASHSDGKRGSAMSRDGVGRPLSR